MSAKIFAGIIAAVMVAAAGVSQAEDAARIEPLDGAQSVKGLSDTHAGRSPLDTRLFIPRADSAPPATAPSGGPLPPHQLTPAPVLPFNPNRSLMPAPTAPSYAPNPAQAETPAYPGRLSGSGRAAR